MGPPPLGLNPIRSPIAGAHATDRRHQLSPNGYGSYTDTPRSVASLSGLNLSPGSGYQPTHMATSSSQSYQNGQNDCSAFPWPNLEVLLEMTCEGNQVTPEVHAKVEKGFFLAQLDQKWTCYRRNYFSVTCSFELHPNINNGRIHLKRNNTTEQVRAMGMRLSAAVDGSTGKTIDLIQHTPKRDAGPKTKIEVVKVSPSPITGRQEHTLSPHGVYQVPMSTFHPTGSIPGPLLPLQHASDPGSSPSPTTADARPSGYPYAAPGSHLPLPGRGTTHTFERVQFKSATANNGKRRASQQYFHLIVELFADVRKGGSSSPTWVKVAQRVSEKIVVRGRSPSHYQNEGQNTQGGRGTGSTGGGGYSSGGGMGYGGHNPGGFRSSNGGYGGSIGSSNGYRSTQYGVHMSSGDSASSPESVEGGAADSDHPMDTPMTDADRGGIQDIEGYAYHPGPIYETIPNQLPLPKIESSARYSTEPRQYAVKAEYADAIPGPHWQLNGCGRFQGFESSRGYFPDLSAGPSGYT
ncbi:hypothetical protein LTR37_017466 [Vermiconidia calcicola]|uniref:Uncharacterized protein n=1 Tax=Vermiconidia calcicola TaxID=1690605 RepID=A0ACC3MMP6_9PEZI|nr:hypothetical protein LTR37_017466 [Vermiconidia calcicola]